MPESATVRAATSADAAFASASDHATSIRKKALSCRAVTQLYLERIRQYNPRLHAIVVSNDADAVRTACERDDELARDRILGPLHGVPVTVKEAFNLRGLQTTVNVPFLRNNVARADALIVRRLRDAGATILGKTNVPAMLGDFQTFGPLYACANNPHDAARTPGGSTGGGAAAVAAGLTTIEIGSDLAGSIRVPAHFCGVFGLKPTENGGIHGEGHVPPLPNGRGGFIAMASVGPLARTMADIELAWDVINRPTWNYFLHLPRKPRVHPALADYRIAWYDDVGDVACGGGTKTVLAAFLSRLAARGARIERRPFDKEWLHEASAVWGVLFGAMAGQDAPWIVRQVMTRRFARSARGAVIDVLGPWKRGVALCFRDFSRALKRRVELVEELQRRFGECDFIVSPAAAGPAFPHNHRHRPIESDGQAIAYLDYALPFEIPYNACGNPVLVVPAGRSGEGLPIGVQIAAPHYAEEELIHFGKLLERLGVACPRPAGY